MLNFQRPSLFPLRLIGVVLGLVLGPWAMAATWIGTWATSPVPEPVAKENLPLADATLRQIVRVSLGGDSVRLRLSNVFGREPLVFHGAHLALADQAGAIIADTGRALTFAGQPGVTVPAGAVYLSDPLEFLLPDQADVAISLHVAAVPEVLTMHGGSRTTSYLKSGDALAATTLPDATTFTRWYFINGLDVVNDEPDAGALVILGDSITDGYGTTTDANNRWPDEFVRLWQARPDAAPLGVLNQGIGGNRLLRDGLGPNALSRFDRDVLAQTGARWVLIFEGINDIGTARDARAKGEEHATAADIIAALEQMLARARAVGLKVIGATITPYAGADFYWSEQGEADRLAVNDWIRHHAGFDAVIDFDAALRDPADPSRLAAAYDSGDHLHPSLAGYRRLAEVVPPDLFTP